jgi:hypothetical protein
VQGSAFPSQRIHALEALSSLIRIPRYTSLKTFLALVTQDTLPDISTKIHAARILHHYSSTMPDVQLQAKETLLRLVEADISLDDAVQAAQALYECYPVGSRQRLDAVRKLLEIAQRSNVSFEQTVQTVEKIRRFLQGPSATPEERQLAIKALADIGQCPTISIAQAQLVVEALLPSFGRDTLSEWEATAARLLKLVKESSPSFDKTVEAAYTLYRGPVDSQGRRQGTQLLLDSIQPDLSFEQAIDVAQALYWLGPDELDERQRVLPMLSRLEPDASFEERIQITEALYWSNPDKSKEQQDAAQKLMDLAQQSPLTFEQSIQAAKALYAISTPRSKEWLQATQMLLELIKQPSISVAQALEIAQILFNTKSSDPKAKEVQQVLPDFVRLVQRPDLTSEEKIQISQVLYQNSPSKSELRQQAAQLLAQLSEDAGLSKNQRLQAATAPLTIADPNYADRAQAVQKVLTLIQGEEAKQHFARYWHAVSAGSSKSQESSDIPYIAQFAREELLLTGIRDEMYLILHAMIPQFDKIDISNS